VADRIDAETVAITLIQHAHDTEPEPQEYLTHVVANLFGMEPDVLNHIVNKWFVDLADELGRRGQEEALRAVLAIQDHWRQEL
jgi:hypothetical protein